MTPLSHRLVSSALVLAAALLFVVGPPAARAITAVPSQIVVSVSPSSPAVGQDVTVTATAKDSSGGTFTGYSAPASWSDSSGTLSPSTPVGFVNGVSRTVARIDRPFRGDVISVTSGSTGKSRAFNVVGPPDHLSTSMSSGITVGTPFTVTVSARDAANNLVTGFAGPATWSDSAGALASSTPNDFVAGVSKTSVQSSAPVRGDRLTVDAGGLSAVSGAFNVVGPATHVEVLAPSSPPAGTAFKITAHARDAAGNIATGYNGPATWTETSGTLTPAAPNDFVAGTSTTTVQVPVAFKSDLVTLTSGGFSARRTFNVFGPLHHIAFTWTPTNVPIDCSSATGSLVARAVDAAGNVLTNYNDPAPTWFLEGATEQAIAPTAPAPFVAGVSNNPSLTITPPSRMSILTIWLISEGKVWPVIVCGG